MVWGVLALLGGGIVIIGSHSVWQETEGVLAFVISVVALGSAGIIDAVNKLREATIKIHSIERTERLQRDLASGNPELVARAKEAVGATS